jgi:NAD(P)-dependent dehydrogenase (short-subunit alcohol dehydrogenase family)
MPSIFVTGAGKGIGRAIVERFVAEGWDVGGITRTAEDVGALNHLGGRFRQADATRAGDIGPIAAEFSSLDILVNNAGLFRYGGFRDITAETLDELWRANVVSAFTVTRAFLPALMRARGRIANIVSMAALKPLPGKAAYCASKVAEAALFRCLREEIAGEGVTVTNIHPGVTYTNSFAGEPVDPAELMSAGDVAEAVFRALTVPGNLVAEELVLQPAQGIRL